MAITPLPDVPLRSDAPATFVTKADAFLGALNQFATEVDAVGVALTLGATNSTSVTSLVIGVGSKSLTVQTGKSYVAGMTLKIASTASPSNWMLGDITSYVTGTGALVINITSILGSGTVAAWTVSQSAPGGAATGANSDITSLLALNTSVLDIGSGQFYKDASGKVGIGTSSPSAVLYIASDATGTDFQSVSSKAGISLNFIGNGVSYYDSDTTIFRASTGSGSAEKMRISSNDNVTLQGNISVGGAAPTTVGTGITFPATQSASSNTNTLDDYEEGTYTPVLTFATNGTMTYTASTANGTYTKIGNVVTCKAYIILSAFSAGTASGAARISLPFTVESLTGNYTGAVYGGVFTTLFPTLALAANNQAYVGLYGITAVNVTPTILNPTNFTATSQVAFSMSYRV